MDKQEGVLWFVLDQSSSERLRRAVPPRYQNEFYHHVTLAYGVERPDVASFVDKPWTIKVYAEAHNSQAQACRVETNGLPDTYGVPHITLSAAEGVKPFASVAMLQGGHEEESIDPIELTGVVKFELFENIVD